MPCTFLCGRKVTCRGPSRLRRTRAEWCRLCRSIVNRPATVPQARFGDGHPQNPTRALRRLWPPHEAAELPEQRRRRPELLCHLWILHGACSERKVRPGFLLAIHLEPRAPALARLCRGADPVIRDSRQLAVDFRAQLVRCRVLYRLA